VIRAKMNRGLLCFAVLCCSLPCCTIDGLGQTTPNQATPKYIVGTGEYQCFIINTATGKLYGIGSNLHLLGTGDHKGEAGLPLPVDVPARLSFTAVASGLHNSLAVDNAGEVWTWGDNGTGQAGDGTTTDPVDNRPHKIIRDSLGRPFNHVVQVVCWWSNTISEGSLALKSDGTVWIWGNTGGGFRGNGGYGQLNTRPVQVVIPGRRRIVKIIAAEIVLALAADGTVWNWGGNGRKYLLGNMTSDYKSPSQVILPQRIRDIAGGGYVSYALGVSGKLYGWGYAGSYLGIGNGGYETNTPVALPRDLSHDLNLPLPVVSVTTNSVVTHVILTDSTLWGWGDNASGSVGNGQELDFTNRPGAPYSWDWGPAELLVQKPVRLAPGIHNFTHVFGGSAAVFYSYAETATGQLYSWGRNKGSVLGNGIVAANSDILAQYPNSWDMPTVRAVDPFALARTYVSTSPYCVLHPDGSPCNQFRTEDNRRPVADAGVSRELRMKDLPAGGSLILDGSSSRDADGTITYYQWSKVSGPPGCRIINPGSANTALTGLTAGIYVFMLRVTDNAWATDIAKIQIKIF
jgi:alpha-tubulin suppressor-like RCC1 family protein